MMQCSAVEPESAPESSNESKTEALRLDMLPVTLPASTAVVGIAGTRDSGNSPVDVAAEREKLIEIIATSIPGSRARKAPMAAAQARLPH